MTGDVRQARLDDHDDVAAFTADTWDDRDVGDYIPDIFPEWVESDGSDQRTVVATVDDRPVGICQARMLTPDEGWLQGMRVDPEHRGADHGRAMVETLFEWCRDQGATVARNMVFGWNTAGMGQSRSVGFDAQTACRWARPDPEEGDAAATGTDSPALSVAEDADAAWRYWTHSRAREELDGLALDGDEGWALSELTRSRFMDLVEDGRVLTVAGDHVRGMTVRQGTREHDGETVADYTVAAWADLEAAAVLFDAISADAATLGVDGTRVCIPETTRHVSDVATTWTDVSDRPVYIFSADLTGR